MNPPRYSHLSPVDLAKRYQVSGMRMRGFLRQRFPDDAPGSGGRWLLTEEQVDVVRRYFDGDRSARASARIGGPVAADATADWYWEGNVQEALVIHLRAQGWNITWQADTGRRERGHDVVASKGSKVLLIEVKGYPSTSYRDPRRAGEVKPTNPSLQAKHWFAEALLKAVRTRVAEPGAEVAVCFPAAPRYESLLRETLPMLSLMQIGVFVVNEQGQVVARTLE